MPKDTSHEESSLKPLSWYRTLGLKKGRIEAGAFLIEGEKAVQQIVDFMPDSIIEVLSTEPLPEIYRRYRQRIVEAKRLKTIVPSVSPQGLAAVVKLPLGVYGSCLPHPTGEKILLLEDIQDPGNVGTLIRTAAALGYSGVIMSEKCADPFSSKAVQSTAGSILSVWIRKDADYLGMVDALKQSGFSLIATVLNAETDVSILRNNSKIILALGNESSGLNSALLGVSDYRLGITIESQKSESLNVAACGAICMYLSCTSKNTKGT